MFTMDFGSHHIVACGLDAIKMSLRSYPVKVFVSTSRSRHPCSFCGEREHEEFDCASESFAEARIGLEGWVDGRAIRRDVEVGGWMY